MRSIISRPYEGCHRNSPRQRGFRPRALGLAISSLLCPLFAQAAPTGGVVTSGSASIVQSGNLTSVTQSSQKAAINWQGFSIAPTETVSFNQPNAAAITLNRVVGNERSVIEGALNANGRIFLINSNGVLFTQGSSVNTAGLVASTLNLSDADFEQGNYVFQGNGSGASVINLGTLTADEGGYIALLGDTVSNQGVITATKGTVALAAGEKITLNFNGDSLLLVTLDEGALNALVENKQAIYADGGKVFLTAKAANEVLGSQVNNSGIVQARTLGDLTRGEIVVNAYGGTANIDGTLDASAPTDGDGGTIETSGKKVKISGSAAITTKANSGTNGEWVIGSDGYTVAASGGDITGARLSSLLDANTTNIRINSTSGSGSNGALNVNDVVTWSSDAKLTLEASSDVGVNAAISTAGNSASLTLTAGEDINVNAGITLSGSNAVLEMNYGGDYHILTSASYSGTTTDADGNLVANSAPEGAEYASITLSGANAGLMINGNSYTLIHNIAELDAIDEYNAVTGSGTEKKKDGHYALAQDIDAQGYTFLKSLISTKSSTSFAGTLAGLGHEVSNLTISASATDYIGLFGYINLGTVRDLGVVNANIYGKRYVGALTGYALDSAMTNVYSSGTIQGTSYLGGLIGRLTRGGLSYAYSEVNITGNGSGYVGGLVGYAQYTKVANSHAVANLENIGFSTGGLVGDVLGSVVESSYASADIDGSPGTYSLGGLVGSFSTFSGYESYIKNSFAVGGVRGGYNLGGLVGRIEGSAYGVISNSYAKGDVVGTYGSSIDTEHGIGGLVGIIYMDEGVKFDIEYSKAYGNVSFANQYNGYAGGLVGFYQAGSGSRIYKSSSYGNVIAPGGSYVGGLAGWLSGVNVSSSSASGNIRGVNGVGGLVGIMLNGTVSDSSFSGTVSGSQYVGGIVGQVASGVDIVNSYFRASDGLVGVGNSEYFTGIDGSVGLGEEQFAELEHYLDGTIDQVLAARTEAAAKAAAEAKARAEAAAELQARSEAGAQLGSTVSSESMRQGARPQQQVPDLAVSPGAKLDSNLVYADTSDFSAGIRRIEVDGVSFELEEEGSGSD